MGQGPLLLLCLGWPEPAYSWCHQTPALAAAGCRVVAPDRRGYGGSSASQAIEDCAITDRVADRVALVAAMGETRAAVVGRACSAMVACSCALMRPDLFAALGLMFAPGGGSNWYRNLDRNWVLAGPLQGREDPTSGGRCSAPARATT